MRLREKYDVPEAVSNGQHSAAFSAFLWNWFGDSRALTNGELDISFLQELTPEEISLARELIRRNLGLKLNHIIEGAAAVRDLDAAPILRRMLDEETDVSRRLTIAGSLWKIDRDPSFRACLEDARSKLPTLFIGVHLWQVLWLEDEQAVDFLVGLLDIQDWTVQSMTLGLLNELEFGRRMGVPAATMPHQPAYYRMKRSDPAFRARMVESIRRRNAASKNGWSSDPA